MERMQTTLKGVLDRERAQKRQGYHHERWVRCSACGQREKVAVSSVKGYRLRDRVSPCCQARMRPLNWRPNC